MDKVLDLIKNFRPSVFGLGAWDIWIGLGVIILTFVLANWLASFLEPTKSQSVKKILTIVFYTVFFGILSLLILNSLLTRRYDRLTVMLFVAVLPYLKRWTGAIYSGYDKFVDRITNK